ncbi:MAG: hypothetical protein M4579_000856 [Chaenotheca gracillima]|nr:MAG: hypothetical protein M4579_000856 [Chaenotheca gracillima]
MSLESALDEERREILRLLEGPRRGNRGPTASPGPSPRNATHGRTESPAGTRSPMRSMLDISNDPPVPRHASIAGLGVGVTNPAGRTVSGNHVRSMLDPMNGPGPSSHQQQPRPGVHSANTSPTNSPRADAGVQRTHSDASSHPPEAGPRLLRDRDKPPGDPSMYSPNSDYQFEMLPSVQNQAWPKRVSQGGKRQNRIPNSMASVVHSTDLGGNGQRGRQEPNTSSKKGKSRSPAPRFGRSQSPRTRSGMLNTNSFNLLPNPGKFVNDKGQVVDMNNAYRRLSDANLARSGGSLSSLPARPGAEHIRADSGEVLSPSGEVRLQKDYNYDEGDDEDAVETSDDDSSSAGDGDAETRGRTGRRQTRGRGADGEWDDGEEGQRLRKDETTSTVGMGKAKGPRKTLSLLAAAEEERQEVSSQYKVQSLLSPSVTVTEPGGDRTSAKKAGVHPSTSFDQGGSGVSTPMTSDTEADISDIRRAQRMNISLSPITSTPESHRDIRTIIRGEFSKMQQEAEEGLRRQRTYLVATDLSDEAAHALEWTIGTVLRDGDTLLAVYAVDEETGTGAGKGGDGESVHGLAIGDGHLAVKDQAAVIGSLTTKAQQYHTGLSQPSPLSGRSLGVESGSASASPDSRQGSKAEQERYHAAQDISDRCVKLLRKTRLQVRVVVEVIHCKSPKHLITEVIDFIEPTLVILGSRGRSALKGVLLGSFSNYLVTKSSVPVMVARKRLKKHSKYRKTNIRLSNNLTPAKSLATAKID